MSGELQKQLGEVLSRHVDVKVNPDRKTMIADTVARREAMVAACGCLAVWTPPESTGRSPQDTVIVRRPESDKNIDWDAPNNLPIDPETFDMVFADALTALAGKPTLYVADRTLDAEIGHALPVRVVTDRALTTLFADNMFRPVPADVAKSRFASRPYTLVVLPYDKLNPARYEGRLRKLPKTGRTSDLVIAIDMDRRLGLVYGSAYCGSVKKHMFTVMNYLLPLDGILSIHCSANEGKNGDVALLLGLSGTGKTTLSADPRRSLLGDDEHSWGNDGVANFENGCYAKLINLSPTKEPDIYDACFHKAPHLEHGAIVENAMMYPDGRFDLDDERYTANSRGSYPLSFLPNIKTPPVAGHPKTILFLTADANGVLPPVARLSRNQAMLWFLMGYTSKLAGTETGIVDPRSTFSRFFGAPFMPLNPDVYARMLGEKLDKHGTKVYLVNTGWSGGAYGVGKRMDISLTREIVESALNGSLADIECFTDPVFHLDIPKSCPGVPDPSVLNPRNTWQDKAAYDERAKKLAAEFCVQFDKAYGKKGIDAAIAAECPGK